MLWYVGMNIFVPMHYPGISELSAIHAPNRTLWSVSAIFYSLLFIAFGFGIWLSANGNRALQLVAAVVIFDSLFGFFWPPMHRREVIAAGGGTLTETLHLVWAFVHLVLMLVMIGYGASVFGKGFRIFSSFIVLIFMLLGILTAIESRGLEANMPTPHVAIWERITIGAYMIWVIVFAVMLMSRNSKPGSKSNAWVKHR